jgi:HNH endonuclease
MTAAVVRADARRLPQARWESILSRLLITESGCWEWAGARDKQGYGRAGYGPRRAGTGLVHRMVYHHVVGTLPDGLELDHTCRNRACANPAHLEPVTHRVNVQRGVAGANLLALAAAVTHCPQGHPYDEANTYRRRNRPNSRECRICRNGASRLYRQGRAK